MTRRPGLWIAAAVSAGLLALPVAALAQVRGPADSAARPAAGAQRDALAACNAYATRAVGQQKQNLAMHCGLSGGGWSLDFAAHRDWCTQPSVTPAAVEHERQTRAAALSECSHRDATCGSYASLAVKQNHANQMFGCGFAGGAWSNDFDAHKSWCKQALGRQVVSETNARAEALEQCASGADSKGAGMQEKLKKVLQDMQGIRQGVIGNLL